MDPQAFSAYYSGLDPQKQKDFLAWIKAVSPQNPATAPIAPQQMSAAQQYQLTTNDDSTNFNYKQQLAQLQQQRAAAMQDYGDTRRQVVDQYTQGRQALPYGFQHRGLQRSGLFNRNIAQGAQRQQMLLSQMGRQNQTAMNAFTLQGQQANDKRTQSLGQNALLKKMYLGQLASSLPKQGGQ